MSCERQYGELEQAKGNQASAEIALNNATLALLGASLDAAAHCDGIDERSSPAASGACAVASAAWLEAVAAVDAAEVALAAAQEELASAQGAYNSCIANCPPWGWVKYLQP